MACYLGRPNWLAAASQCSLEQCTTVEDPIDVLDEMHRIEVHNRAVEVQEGKSTWIGAVVVADFGAELAALVEVSP